MHMSFENPVFLLIWIVAVLIVTIPIIVAGITTAINGYFKAKEQHIAKMAKAIGSALEKPLQTVADGLEALNKKVE